MSDPDELYTLRNLFWLGNFQNAINEAASLTRIPAKLLTEKDEYLYRSYLSLGQYHIITGEIKDSQTTPIGLRAIKLLANYMSNPSSKDTGLLKLKEYLNSGESNSTLHIIGAIIFMYEDDLKEAIKCVHKTSNMEEHALLVQLYLRIDRVDLAQKQVKTMKTIDEDHTLVLLASAWTNLATGGTKVQEAAYAYDELIDKYGGSCVLLNGLAVAKMHGGHFEESETYLQEALTKAPSDSDTLANLITVSQHLQRSPEVIARYLSQLKAKSPNHSLCVGLATFEGAFDRVSNTLKT